MVVLGLMSGTSLDGLDLALVEFLEEGREFKLLAAETIKYPKKWESALKNARFLSAQELTALNVNYGKYTGKLVNKFLTGKTKPDLIASHGHTVFHQPKKGFTLQIGSLIDITVVTGIQTVGDFRAMDVSKGGEGAPLVPAGDEFLFSNYDYCVNLGGICNYSFSDHGVRKAKDLSPCNIISNSFMNELGFEFDDEGKEGAKGQVNQQLLEELASWDYYKNGRSLGIEDLEENIFPIFAEYEIPIQDILRTYYEHIAQIIGGALNREESTALFTGGGVKNTFLIDRIRVYSQAEIIIPEDDLVDFKEAIIFALLGFLRVNNQTNILSSVTGANSDSCSGVVVG